MPQLFLTFAATFLFSPPSKSYKPKKHKMMKTKQFGLLLLAMLMMASCSRALVKKTETVMVTVKHEVRPFERIRLKGMCDVRFVQSDSVSVKVEGDEMLVSQVKISNNGSTLDITTPEHQNFSFKKKRKVPTIYITAPDLIGVELVGMGNFTVRGKLDTDTLNVMLRGMGDITMDQVVCDKIDVKLIGMGDYDIKSLTAQRSKLLLKGMGDMNINFENSGQADCSLMGMGDITLKGTVHQLIQNKRGTGDIDTDGLKWTK